jgi:hypothetical protein
MSGRRSRDKGARTERHFVRLLQAAGFAAEKCSRTGYSGHDISLPLLNRDLAVECKARSEFATLYRWLASADLLVLKADRQEPLIVVPLRLAIEIATAAERASSA